MHVKDGRLQWHPAFDAALHIELEEDLDILDIQSEYILSRKPMQIDILIVKKDPGQRVKKKIGHLFRENNIIEYKSPEDYLSINDFYKVYGYTCFYQSDTKRVCDISPEELTITYVTCFFPRKLIRHLQKVRGLTVWRYAPGIYYLEGDMFPMQIIVTKQLSKKEYYWLQKMRTDIKDGKEIRELVKKYECKKTSPYHQAVMDLIVRANREQMEEEESMCEALRELFADELKKEKKNARREGLQQGIEQGIQRGMRQGIEQGIQRGMQQGIQRGMQQGLQQGIQQGIAQGESRGIRLTKTVFRLSHAGSSVKEIAEKCAISEQKVLAILQD